MIAPMDFDYLDDSDSSIQIGHTRKRIRRISSSEDSEDDQCGSFINEDYVWKAENHTPIIHNFSSVGGATLNTQNLSRRKVFELFFNKELVTKLITETNKHGATDKNFIPLTDGELKVFIALNILMSLVSKPTIQSYWSTDKSIETPYFKNIMCRTRFVSIAKNLDFSSNNNSDDPLTKIREVSEVVKKTFIRMYVPHKNISIDESLMQCRSHFAETGKTNRYTGQKCMKPTVVIDYNQYMSGVDVGDQMLNMMLLNSYVLFKNHKKDQAFHVYKQLLAEEIIRQYLPNIKAFSYKDTCNSSKGKQNVKAMRCMLI
ncbi:piggyBac transposable element-derived protein 4 [Cephus cinctus]|uniref:PiggyBac transposable element-derived protein 4 n=1 Tax=Cephus cinctus TaxID=211228 RepID=A0AAJ7W437_CEPCN|nr:piggyBac transposable element-derived protein 4 [Cephus cinctus]